MAADKASSNRRAKNGVSRDPTAISDDITRIVGYLNTKRSSANDLASGLVQEISHNREESSGQLERNVKSEAFTELSEREQLSSRGGANPVLAERYHAFCHDMDIMLDSFRARVEGKKPVKH